MGTPTRQSETREASKRPESWRPPEALPTPDPIPGYAFRWVRVAIMGDPDPSNLSSKRREGYEFCRAEDHPELLIPTASSGKYAGLIEYGGLVLAKIPEEFIAQRNAYYEDMNKAQVESVDQSYFKENHPNMRKFSESESRVTKGFGKGGPR